MPAPRRRSPTQHGAKVADGDAVFGDAAVKAIVIASSTDTHADLILRAAAAGKAIFCEKPVDLALERAKSCAQAVAKAGVPCLIGFQRRYDPTFSALKARIDAGEIGAPEMLVVTSRDPGAPPAEYLKRSGGIFKDMLIHDFDIFRWILDDEAETVYATGSVLTDPSIATVGDIDATAVTIRTKKGRLAQINTIRRAAYGYDQRFEVIGEQGHAAGGQSPADRGRRVERRQPSPPTSPSISSSSATAPPTPPRWRTSSTRWRRERRSARRSTTASRRWRSPRPRRCRGAKSAS